MGNRITSAGVTGAWSYNANNELLGYGANSFNYDANGNMVQKTAGGVVTNFIYNVEDRLTEVRYGSGNLIATYYYDPFGRRLWKEVDGVRVYFLYSDEGLIGEYDALGTELRTYGYVPDGNWTTDPLFQKSGGIYYWYRNDHLGTPQKITATSGAVVWAATYDSFGNVEIDVSGITSNLRFGGQYYDAETGLYYNLNRYYDPATGRYLRADPFGDGINLYAYVFNNPNSLIDPMGLCAVSTGFNFLGRMLGTGFGEESAMWYAQRFNETGSWYYAAGGLFASLWTPETYLQTAITLATAPLVAAKITIAGTRSTAAAARAAVKEVVEEVIGVPVPSNPKGLFTSRLKGSVASKSLATIADEAVFWSGIRNGDTAAAKWVSQHGGSTLETTLANHGIKLPAWDASNPASVTAWRQASKEFAAVASGKVRVLQTDAVRIKSIWAEVEFPALKANQKVTSITAVNPETGVEILLWSR